MPSSRSRDDSSYSPSDPYSHSHSRGHSHDGYHSHRRASLDDGADDASYSQTHGRSSRDSIDREKPPRRRARSHDPYPDYSHHRSHRYRPDGSDSEDKNFSRRTIPEYSPPRRRRTEPIREEPEEGEDRRHRRDSRRQGYSPDRRTKSPTKHNSHGDDDGEDTDYDPRDKYYLYRDKDRDGHHGHRSSVDRQHDPQPDDSKSTGSDNRHRSSRRSRDSDEKRSYDRHSPSDSRRKSMSDSMARSRPSRPRSPHDHGNSHRSRGSSVPGRSTNPHSSFLDSIPWKKAGKSAMRAAALAALRMSTQEGDWIGSKGGKVATAALGAALVDTFIDEKAPQKKGGMQHQTIKHIAEAAIGNMLINPATKKGAEKRKK